MFHIIITITNFETHVVLRPGIFRHIIVILQKIRKIFNIDDLNNSLITYN